MEADGRARARRGIAPRSALFHDPAGADPAGRTPGRTGAAALSADDHGTGSLCRGAGECPEGAAPGRMGSHLPQGAEGRWLAWRPRTVQSRIPGAPGIRRGARRFRPTRHAAWPAVAQRGGAPLVATLPATHLPAGNPRPARHPGPWRAGKCRPRLRCTVGDGHERRSLAAAAASQPVAAGRIAARGRGSARQRRGRARFRATGACPSDACRTGGGVLIRAGRRQPPAAAEPADRRHCAGRCGAGRGGDAGPATGRGIAGGARSGRGCHGAAGRRGREGSRRQLAAARPGDLPGLGLLPVPARRRGAGRAGRGPRPGGPRHAGP